MSVLSFRRGREEAERWARRECEVSGGPYWEAVLRRVREPVPRAERHGAMAATLRPAKPREEPIIRGRALL